MDTARAIEQAGRIWRGNITELASIRKRLREEARSRVEAEVDELVRVRRSAAARAIHHARELGASKTALRNVTTRDHWDFESYVSLGEDLANGIDVEFKRRPKSASGDGSSRVHRRTERDASSKNLLMTDATSNTGTGIESAATALTAEALAESKMPSEIAPYKAFSGELKSLSESTPHEIIQGVLEIVGQEGPVLGHRIHDVYLSASTGSFSAKELSRALNRAIAEALRTALLLADEPDAEVGIKPKTFRLPGQPLVRVRDLGPRSVSQVPTTERAALMALIVENPDLHSAQLYKAGIHELQNFSRHRIAATWPPAPRS